MPPILQTTKRWISGLSQFVWPHCSYPQKRHWDDVARIIDLSKTLTGLSKEDILDRIKELRRRVAEDIPVHDETILYPGLALLNEVFRRILSIRLHPEQILAGIFMVRRVLVEMQTGEGKTFVAAMPAFLQGLSGKGVHVVTVNEYLARRDFEILTPIYNALGMTVGLIAPDKEPKEKKDAYACDVTYGVDQEFGFDYLRDQIQYFSQPRRDLGEGYRAALRGRKRPDVFLMQRGLSAAVVDEADSVLMDASTSPLLLSVTPEDVEKEAEVFYRARDFAEEFQRDFHFRLDPSSGQVALTAEGKKKAFERTDKIPESGLYRPWLIYIEQALRAKHTMNRDVDYVVQDGKVLFVDEYTGRIQEHQKWREGLHQALEAKEELVVHSESHGVARISRQRFFHSYKHLCGMTGTARGGERELWSIYRLRVMVVPPHVPCRRESLPLQTFATEDEKFAAIIHCIVERHRLGQPILVGTRTIENSIAVARRLDIQNVPYHLLNGKQDVSEAVIIARAGDVGAGNDCNEYGGTWDRYSAGSRFRRKGRFARFRGRMPRIRTNRPPIGRQSGPPR